MTRFLLLLLTTTCLASVGFQGEAKPAIEVPYRLSATRHMLVRIKINGQGPYSVVLDTGAPVVVLAGKLKDSLGITPDAGGWATLERVEIEGGVAIDKLTARFDDLYQLEGMNGLGLAGTEIHGLIGYPILARYRITYDLTKPTLLWSPVEGPIDELPRRGVRNVAPGGLDTLGSVMKGFGKLLGMNQMPAVRLRGFLGMSVDESGRITQVLPDGPAAKAGVCVGDIGPRLEELSKLIATVPTGQTLEIRLLRDSREFTVSIPLGQGF